MNTCWRLGVRVGVGSVLVLVACASGAAGATRTWDGPSGGNWSVAANWQPVGTPLLIDDLVFPDPGGPASTVADASLWQVNSITINGEWTVTGTARVEVAAGLSASGSAAISINVQLVTNANQTWTIGAPTLSLSSLGLENECTISSSAGASIAIGPITGFGTLVKDGDGGLSLTGDNSGFFGPVTVNGGVLTIASGGNLGETDGSQAQGTTINAPGSLEYNGGGPFAETLFLNGAGSLVLLSSTATTAVFTGGMTLLTTSGVKATQAAMEFQQPIAGPGGLQLHDDTTVVLNAPAPSSFPTLSFTGLPGGVLKTGRPARTRRPRSCPDA